MAHNNLGVHYFNAGRYEEALNQYNEVIQIDPHNAGAWNNLGNVLVLQGHLNEAAKNYRKAIAISPDYAEAHDDLGFVLNQLGRTKEAITQYREGLTLNPKTPRALAYLAWIFASNPKAKIRNGPEAVRLAEQACQLTEYRDANFLGILGAAYASVGRFEDATAAAQAAEALATAAGDERLAEKSDKLMKLFSSRQSVHQASRYTAAASVRGT